jgi:hypothetical protein
VQSILVHYNVIPLLTELYYRFTQIYNTLPPEAKQVLIEKHLAGLIDLVSKTKSKKGIVVHIRGKI